jgi:hypothetical protein
MPFRSLSRILKMLFCSSLTLSHARHTQLDKLTSGMRTHISDVLGCYKSYVIAISDDRTLWQFKPNHTLSKPADKLRAIRHCIANYETVPFELCNRPFQGADVTEIAMETRNLILTHRERDQEVRD